ncbi:MAG: ankyrin repeat domain-containing protein [Treponema sp.]|nr:ankyrin repeat domain-containing protein [Treponema sp.]
MIFRKQKLILFIFFILFTISTQELFSKGQSDAPQIPELIIQKIENTEETTKSWSLVSVKDKKIKEEIAGPLDSKEEAIALFIYLKLQEEKFAIAKNQTFITDKPSNYYRNEYAEISKYFEAEGDVNAIYHYFQLDPPKEEVSDEAKAIIAEEDNKTEEKTKETSESKEKQETEESQSLDSSDIEEDYEEEIVDPNQIQYAQNNVVLIETVSQEELIRRKKLEEKQKESVSDKKNGNQTYTLIEDDAEPIPPRKDSSNNKNSSQGLSQSFSIPLASEESASIARYQQEYLHDYETFGFPELPDEEISIPLKKIDNPNSRDQFGRTYLMKAAKAGNNWQLKNLLNSGADVNLTDNDGWTALMYAARYQENTEIINNLLSAGADVKITNNFDISALSLACSYNNNPDIINKLLSYYSISEKEVMAAFILLLTNNITDEYVQIAKINIFLSKSIPLNTYSNGKTPLMYAAQFSNSTKIIQLLLDNDANISIRSTEGKTAFEYASKNKNLPHDETYWKLNKIMNKN